LLGLQAAATGRTVKLEELVDIAAAATEGDEDAEVKSCGSGWELLYCGETSFDTMGLKVVGRAQGKPGVPKASSALAAVEEEAAPTNITCS